MNTGVGSLFLLQEIFPRQELNQVLLYCRQIFLPAQPSIMNDCIRILDDLKAWFVRFNKNKVNMENIILIFREGKSAITLIHARKIRYGCNM